jgi:hypothetical protein
MRRFTFLLASTLFAAEPFITPREYGAAIYNDYESLACVVCHGRNAEGKTLAYYERKRKSEAVFAPPLKNLGESALKKGLLRHGFGPPYYLSDSELNALSVYLRE